jgi:hypothetical protein
MISMFIDDELEIDDKIAFVERVHKDRTFKDESIDLLHQEKVLRAEVVDRAPPVTIPVRKKFFFPLVRPMALFASGVAAALIIMFLSLPSQVETSAPYRFVIHQPGVTQVEITGSFTDWRKIPLKKLGSSGYWEITLSVPQGEHRFTYILEGHQRIADPTVLAREKDDFGGENSILYVET